MGGKGMSLKASFGAVILICFMIWCLFVGVLTNTETKKSKRDIQLTAKLVAKKRVGMKSKTDPNYVSKKRVPNGPDPIHNRRAGKYRQPPRRV